ncbi:hypothetical protein KXD40_009334 [Peronospora effusa]|nr:hypothetical protein KXD40_009334 [Peronospora effusa]
MRCGVAAEAINVSVSFCPRRGEACRIYCKQSLLTAWRKLQMQKVPCFGACSEVLVSKAWRKHQRLLRTWDPLLRSLHQSIFAVRMRVQLHVAEINAMSDKNRLPKGNDTRRVQACFQLPPHIRIVEMVLVKTG